MEIKEREMPSRERIYRSCDGYYLCEGGCRALVPAYGQRCLACPPSTAPVAPVREDGYSSVCT